MKKMYKSKLKTIKLQNSEKKMSSRDTGFDKFVVPEDYGTTDFEYVHNSYDPTTDPESSCYDRQKRGEIKIYEKGPLKTREGILTGEEGQWFVTSFTMKGLKGYKGLYKRIHLWFWEAKKFEPLAETPDTKKTICPGYKFYFTKLFEKGWREFRANDNECIIEKKGEMEEAEEEEEEEEEEEDEDDDGTDDEEVDEKEKKEDAHEKDDKKEEEEEDEDKKYYEDEAEEEEEDEKEEDEKEIDYGEEEEEDDEEDEKEEDDEEEEEEDEDEDEVEIDYAEEEEEEEDDEED